MKWFKHDSNASADAKLKKVKLKYGMTGYGLYWFCLELIAGDIEKTHITFELEHDAEVIAHDTGISVELVNEMMAYMVDLGLFENTNGKITCYKIAKRLDQSMTSNPVMRKLIDDIRHHHDGVMIQSENVMQDKTRLDKKRISNSRFTPPTHLEVEEYAKEKGYQVDAIRFCNFYGSKDWMVGKNKMKNWHMSLANWVSNNPDAKQGNAWDGAI